MRPAVFLLVAVLSSGCATARHSASLPMAPSTLPARSSVAATACVATNQIAEMPPRVGVGHWSSDEELRTAAWDPAGIAALHLGAADSGSIGSPSTRPPEENPFSKAYLALILTDIKETFTAPAQWDTRDWLICGGVVAGISTVAVFDEDIQRAVQRNRTPTLDDISKAIQPFGNEYAPGVLGAFYLGGELFHDSRAKDVALDGASASIIASGLIDNSLKYTVGRARPGANLGAYHFNPFSGNDSFPSGHSTEAFALATVIAEHYDSIWIKIGSYGLASMVGYARMDLNYHWASDVLAGAAIGTFVGHVVVHVNHNRWGVAVQPLIGPDMQGVALSCSF